MFVKRYVKFCKKKTFTLKKAMGFDQKFTDFLKTFGTIRIYKLVTDLTVKLKSQTLHISPLHNFKAIYFFKKI